MVRDRVFSAHAFHGSRSLSTSSAGPLDGKVAIITGSTSGLGKGIAGHLARQGCSITLNGFGNSEDIERVVQEISDFGGAKAMYHNADLSCVDEIEDLVEKTASTFGSVDILVNNAGIQHVSPIDAFPRATWDKVIAVNLSAVFHTSRLAIPLMRKNGWGRIINISSVHGLVGSVNKSAYVAAKHGVTGLTKVTALETAEEDITCNCICPGWVYTPLVAAQVQAIADSKNISIGDATKELLSEKQPTKRFVEISDIAAMVEFMCGENAGGVTGSIYTMDGGWTAV